MVRNNGKELSLSLAIYEYANIGNEDFFVTVNDKAKRRWISLLQYGMDSGEFKNVDAQQVADLILYYYQGLRMWSRVVPLINGKQITMLIVLGRYYFQILNDKMKL